MNWTGGRLHRHSSTNVPRPKHKRQAVRKSRLDTSQGPRQVPLFHRLAQNSVLDAKGDTFNDNGNHDSHEQSPTISPPLSSIRPSQPSTRLERIKRQLLEKTDWAAVSAARPLKMNFPPLEELVQFGRRRKLTEADRERLKSDNQVLREGPLFRRDFRRDMTPSEGETIDGLEIRINGKRAGGGGGVAAEDAQQNNVSSQSMLLDREDPLPREQRISDVLSEDMPSEYSSVLPDYHSSRTSLLSSPSNIWISQSRYRSGSLSD